MTSYLPQQIESTITMWLWSDVGSLDELGAACYLMRDECVWSKVTDLICYYFMKYSKIKKKIRFKMKNNLKTHFNLDYCDFYQFV